MYLPTWIETVIYMMIGLYGILIIKLLVDLFKIIRSK
jgi:hypothetical protein